MNSYKSKVMTHAQALWVMVAVTLMWSIAGVVARHLEYAKGFEMTFWRSFFNFLALLILLPALRGRAVFSEIRKEGKALWISGLAWGVMFTAFMMALGLTSVANVLVTGAVGPLLSALLARVFMGQRIAARTWVAIVLAGVGMGYMYGAQLDLGASMLGTWVALLVPLAAAVNWTLVQRSHAHGHDIDLTLSVLIGAAVSCVVSLPLALPFSASAHDLSLLALLGLVQLAIPCVLAVLCAKALKPPEMALLALLEVIFGIALAWLGAHEVPGREVLVGGAVVMGALVLNETLAWRQRR